MNTNKLLTRGKAYYKKGCVSLTKQRQRFVKSLGILLKKVLAIYLSSHTCYTVYNYVTKQRAQKLSSVAGILIFGIRESIFFYPQFFLVVILKREGRLFYVNNFIEPSTFPRKPFTKEGMFVHK